MRDIKVKSADRVLTVFEFFERTRQPATLGEISQALEIPVSSTLALLRSMQNSGYLSFDQPKKIYFPTLRLTTLGSWLTESVFLDAYALRVVAQLAEETKETIILGIQNGVWAQYIYVVQGRQSLRYHPPTGTMRPMLRSAIGRALVGCMPDDKVKQLVALTSKLLEESDVIDEATVMADIRQVRIDGYAYNDNTFTQGAGVIAVALPETPGRIRMAVGIGGSAARMHPNQRIMRDKIVVAIQRYQIDLSDDLAS